jgi:hypothetical protein
MANWLYVDRATSCSVILVTRAYILKLRIFDSWLGIVPSPVIVIPFTLGSLGSFTKVHSLKGCLAIASLPY